MKLQSENKIYDLIILGAGPVGLYASFLAGYFKLDVLCLERDETVGGQASKLYPFKMVHDFPGQQEIKATDLVEKLHAQATQFNNVQIKTNVQIISYFINEQNIIVLVDADGENYYCNHVLFTIGLGAFEPIKLDNSQIDQEDDLDKKVFYSHDSNGDYNNKRIVIFGGGDSAVEYAYQIKRDFPTANITLVHRGEKLRAIVHTYDQLVEANINVMLNTNLVKINANFCVLNQQENIYEHEYDYALVQFGLKSLGSNVHQWTDFKKEKMKFVVDNYYQTSVQNFFAAGTCCYNSNKIDMIATGISEATVAINYIYTTLNTDASKLSFYTLKNS